MLKWFLILKKEDHVTQQLHVCTNNFNIAVQNFNYDHRQDPQKTAITYKNVADVRRLIKGDRYSGNMYNAIKLRVLGAKVISKEVKDQVTTRVVRPIFTYGCKSRKTMKRNKSRLRSTDIRFLKRTEGTTIREKVRNTYRSKRRMQQR